VAPFTLRRELEARIRGEIEAARAGRTSRIVARMNALEDPGMVALLQEGEAAGVPTDLIVRVVCCLAPGTGPGEGASLRARSILDRSLEHGRAYLLHDGGEEAIYLASSDWMKRKLKRRVEVAFPLYDPGLRSQVKACLELQLADTGKARIIDSRQTNAYVSRGEATPPVRSQSAIRTMVGELPRRGRAAPPSSPSTAPASRDSRSP
jgi:polyphosphate kinase